MMKRALTSFIRPDLPQKMVFVTGPRQVGKTTLARDLGGTFKDPLYLNYDAQRDRARITAADWAVVHDYVVLDEIHTMPGWKPYLKGVFDTKPATQALLVTGSARLDTFRQGSESLAGRYLRWRLHPISVKEFLSANNCADAALDALMRFGGFPEPLLKGTEAHRKRWQNQYFTDLVREDVLEFGRIHEVRAMRTLVEMLRRRTGSPMSIDALGRDLGIAPGTVRSYLGILEALHIVFMVRPYHRNIARAQAKAAKIYFYDWAYVQGTIASDPESDGGAQFENLVAVHLLKHLQFLEDSAGMKHELHYVRTTANKEIDFVIANEAGEATHFIEVKLADEKPSYALKQMAHTHPNAAALQIVMRARHAYVADGVSIHPAARWLAALGA